MYVTIINQIGLFIWWVCTNAYANDCGVHAYGPLLNILTPSFMNFKLYIMELASCSCIGRTSAECLRASIYIYTRNVLEFESVALLKGNCLV